MDNNLDFIDDEDDNLDEKLDFLDED